MSESALRVTLLASTILAAATVAPAARAQGAASTANSSTLEEVVVTATRQTSTVNKVALSVSAVTQKNLDQQGIRSVADLSGQVPGFTFRTTSGEQNPQLSIRGIGGNAIAGTGGGAPTTAIYIDDVALQQRNLNGAANGGGSPLPLMYDLDRIEVLRGPQGTLYGASSEGGTVRFITPQPSLTIYSGSARVGVSTIAGGGIGSEEGLALGGPIVQDKLGFRVSGFHQVRPGWINAYSEYDGHQFASGINKGDDYALRGSILWQATPNLKATLSVQHQFLYNQDSNTVRTSGPAINVPVRTIANTGTIQGVRFSFPATVYGGYTVPATTFLSNGARNGVVNGMYLSPDNPVYQPSPRRTIFTIPSLTLDYTWGDKFDIKSITAEDSSRTSGLNFSGGGGNRSTVLPNLTNQPCPSGPGLMVPVLTATCTITIPYLQFASTSVGAGIPSPNPSGQPGPANSWNTLNYNNRRDQVTQEFRISTIDPSWKLQFVAGAYIEHAHNHEQFFSNGTETYWAEQVRGPNAEAYYNGALPVPFQQVPGAPAYTDIADRNVYITEDEQSLFAEANYAVTAKLKFTAGVRLVNYTQLFLQQYGGPVSGGVAGWKGSSDTGAIETNPNSTTPFTTNYGACPPEGARVVQTQALGLQYAAAGCPYQYTYTRLSEHPVLPKVSLSYQLTPSDLLYVTYAEGERPGGINPPISPILCASNLAALGLTASPGTYQHDTVKSTEIGGKFRLFDGHAQINASAFHIAWDNVQFVVAFTGTCGGFSFIANAANASSDGAELQATARFLGFTVNGNLSYDNARYTEAVKGPPPLPGQTQSYLANKGDNLGIPDWTGNIGVQYDWQVMSLPAYARLDYAYQGKYLRTTTKGTASFNAALTPNYINGGETHVMNLRAGVYYKNLEIAGYVKNVGDSREWVNLSQGNGNYYFTGNTVQPRQIGMQLNYRF